MAPILPRKLCVACRGAFAALDAKLCVQCERLAEAKLDQLTLMIQDYERRYDRSFARLDDQINSAIESGLYSVSEVIELTEADFIDEALEAIRNGVDDATDIPSASGFNKSR